MQPIVELEDTSTNRRANQEKGKLVNEMEYVVANARNMGLRRSTRRRVTNSFLKDYVT